jgi:hypothetical protein
MPIFPPLFALGKANSRTVSTFTLNASSTTILLSSAASPIAVGSHVFVSNADNGFCEYLGKATAVSGSTVTTMFRGQRSRAAGALVWTPAASWQATSVISLGACDQPWLEGIDTLETTDGYIHTRVMSPHDFVQMTWSQADRADWAALKTWLRANVDGGIGSFTAAWADPDAGTVATCKVKLREPGREWSAQATAFRLRSWVVGLCIVLRDSYL